jgi:hypothetical protein
MSEINCCGLLVEVLAKHPTKTSITKVSNNHFLSYVEDVSNKTQSSVFAIQDRQRSNRVNE